MKFETLLAVVGPLGINPPCQETANGISLTGQAEVVGVVSVTPKKAADEKWVEIRLVQDVKTHRESIYVNPLPGKTKSVFTTNGAYALDTIEDGTLHPGDTEPLSTVDYADSQIRINFRDQPSYGWDPGKVYFNSLSMNDQFKIYLQAKLKTQSANEWKTIGAVDWSLSGSCAKTGTSGTWSGGTTMAPISCGSASTATPVFSPHIKSFNDIDQ